MLHFYLKTRKEKKAAYSYSYSARSISNCINKETNKFNCYYTLSLSSLLFLTPLPKPLRSSPSPIGCLPKMKTQTQIQTIILILFPTYLNALPSSRNPKQSPTTLATLLTSPAPSSPPSAAPIPTHPPPPATPSPTSDSVSPIGTMSTPPFLVRTAPGIGLQLSRRRNRRGGRYLRRRRGVLRCPRIGRV